MIGWQEGKENTFMSKFHESSQLPLFRQLFADATYTITIFRLSSLAAFAACKKGANDSTFLFMGFSLLSMKRISLQRNEPCETKNHPLCGCGNDCYTKNHLSVIIELFRLLS